MDQYAQLIKNFIFKLINIEKKLVYQPIVGVTPNSYNKNLCP